MIHEIFMPALSSTMTEGKIVDWVKAPGDKVEKGETVLIVESDKADMDVESFYEGYLAAIVVPAGQNAPVGNALAYIAETEAEIPEAQQRASGGGAAAAPAAPAPAAAPVAVAAPAAAPANAPVRTGRTMTSPRAKKLAKDLGINLDTVTGSGPHGRITSADVQAKSGVAAPAPTAVAVASIAAVTAVAAAPAAASRQASASPAVGSGQVVAFTGLQNAVNKNMMASLDVPVFRVSYTITTDALDALYKQVKPKGVTMTALLAKAIGNTLKKHPLVNARFTDQGIQYNPNINVAIAVAMEDGGLITPVLANADQVDLYAMSRSWADLVARARSKQLKPDEYTTGTFTISNLGMFGVDSFDAILPPGQGAIIAIGGSKAQVVATADGMLGIKRQMQVNITCDHRIIYGADAAAFLKDLAKLIETDCQSLTM
jgi:pyruvate dehydrogenase E2 component (dihydrolipoamide acetyltransferase)